MLKTVEISRASKTKGCAVTYRAGDQSVFDTCPKDCSLNPSGCGSDMPDLVYMATVLNAKPRAGESMTYSHFHPKWYTELLGQIRQLSTFLLILFKMPSNGLNGASPPCLLLMNHSGASLSLIDQGNLTERLLSGARKNI